MVLKISNIGNAAAALVLGSITGRTRHPATLTSCLHRVPYLAHGQSTFFCASRDATFLRWQSSLDVSSSYWYSIRYAAQHIITGRAARQNQRGKQETRVSDPCHIGNTHEKGKLGSQEYRRRKHPHCWWWCEDVEHRHKAGAPLPNSEILHKHAEIGPREHDVKQLCLDRYLWAISKASPGPYGHCTPLQVFMGFLVDPSWTNELERCQGFMPPASNPEPSRLIPVYDHFQLQKTLPPVRRESCNHLLVRGVLAWVIPPLHDDNTVASLIKY